MANIFSDAGGAFTRAVTNAGNDIRQVTGSPAESVQQFLGSAFTQAGNVLGAVADGVKNTIINDTGFGKALRALNLIDGANPTQRTATAATFINTGADWRVRLSIPYNFDKSPLISPLVKTNGFVFPYTPQIMVTHSAHYNPIEPVHNNYAYYAYQNSRVESMTITGEFLIENSLEAEYWIGAVHYLRAVTKSAYGGNYGTIEQGSPPPVLRLNGYGDFMFNNLPVIITQFNVELSPNCDYVQVIHGTGKSWVPTSSNISISVTPIYSRTKVSQFSYQDFVNGEYVEGKDGFI